MSEVSTAVAGEQNEQGQEAAPEFAAITSQEDFDKQIQARIARERAKFADYDDVKAKASQFEQLENDQKTETQKATDRAEAAEKRANELEARTTRAEVSAAKGVPANLLSGSTQAELEASADALIAFRGEQKQAPKSDSLNRVNNSSVGGDESAFARSLFNDN